MRSWILLVASCIGLQIQAQQLPKNALAITIGTSFYQEAKVTGSGEDTHARFELDAGWGAALSYRRWLAPKWYLTGTFRTDLTGMNFNWSGNMEPMGHWAGPNDKSIGLPPHQFYFSAFRADLGRAFLNKGRWSLRGEAGVELLLMPSLYMGYSHTATVNGQQVPGAVSYGVVTNPEGVVFQRVRVGISSAYTDKRLNEWVFGIAGQLALQREMVQGGYTVETPTGPERGTFTAALNAVEVGISRYFTWGRPKLPRWAGQDGPTS